MEPRLVVSRLFERMMLWLMLLVSPFTLGGCRAIAAIFKAGFWAGAIIVVVVVVIIAGLVWSFTRGGRGGGGTA